MIRAVRALRHGYIQTEKGKKMKLAGLLVLFVGISSLAFASTTVPEIGVGSAGSALALVSGALLVLRGRKK